MPDHRGTHQAKREKTKTKRKRRKTARRSERPETPTRSPTTGTALLNIAAIIVVVVPEPGWYIGDDTFRFVGKTALNYPRPSRDRRCGGGGGGGEEFRFRATNRYVVVDTERSDAGEEYGDASTLWHGQWDVFVIRKFSRL